MLETRACLKTVVWDNPLLWCKLVLAQSIRLYHCVLALVILEDIDINIDKDILKDMWPFLKILISISVLIGTFSLRELTQGP